MKAEEILEIIKGIRKNGAYFGIRKANEEYSVGDELENSFNWSMDEDIDGTPLDGVCTTGFGCLWFDGEEDDLKAIQEAMDYNDRTYDGDHQYLVYGNSWEHGEDQNEIILSGAKVVGIIK